MKSWISVSLKQATVIPVPWKPVNVSGFRTHKLIAENKSLKTTATLRRFPAGKKNVNIGRYLRS